MPSVAKLKYCKPVLHSDQSECFIWASKKYILFLFFASLHLHVKHQSAQTHGTILELKNRRKKIPVFFGFSSKNKGNDSCEVSFDIPPRLALNLSPLAGEVGLLPTWAEVYDISWVLHCFDDALQTYQHVNRSWLFFKSKWREEATIFE